MNFKTVSVVKFPLENVWDAMLHHLPRIAESVTDIDRIIEKERSNISANITKVVNVWEAKPNLPSVIAKQLKAEMFVWTDTAQWSKKEKKIEWHIFSHYFREKMKCEGTTIFEPAMGGTGCKMTFSGAFQWKENIVSLGIGFLDSAVSKKAESVLAQLIPSNFQKLSHAMTTYLTGHLKK